MEASLKKLLKGLMCIVVASALCACENVFHNDRLDFMWRLDSVKFVEGTDLAGQPCTEREMQRVYFSFARDLVEVERLDNSFGVLGVLTDETDALKLDFSMCQSVADLEENLHYCGIPQLVTTFKVDRLDSKKMVLSCDKTILSFTKW